jgi:hypothetical protein
MLIFSFVYHFICWGVSKVGPFFSYVTLSRLLVRATPAVYLSFSPTCGEKNPLSTYFLRYTLQQTIYLFIFLLYLNKYTYFILLSHLNIIFLFILYHFYIILLWKEEMKSFFFMWIESYSNSPQLES